MDPNANLKEQLALSEKILLQYDDESTETPSVNAEDAARLCHLVEAMNKWLSSSGFLPRAWEPGQEPCDECAGIRYPHDSHEEHCSLYDSEYPLPKV
jgi:hypothetical protein